MSTLEDCSRHTMPSLVIPPDKFDVYLRYKKGTREIVTWLMRFGSRKYKNAKTITIRDLTHIVETMRTKKITMPETIHYLFRETISARSQLSKFFRDQFASNTEDPDTVNHEFFTKRFVFWRFEIYGLTIRHSLSQIYSDLCHCCNQPPNKCRKAAAKQPSHSKHNSASNRYAVLPEEVDQSHTDLQTPVETCQECTKSASICTAGNKAPRLAEDGLGDSFELSVELKVCSDSLHSDFLC